MNIAEIRQKYPQYNHADDQTLADALHAKYYTDAPKEEFYNKIGFTPESSLLNKVSSEVSGAAHMPLGRSLKNIGQGAVDLAEFLTNPAGPGMKFLAQQNIPYISKGAQHWPQYPESDIFGLGEEQPGDTLFQAATPLGSAAKGAKLAGKSLEEIAKFALSKGATTTEKAIDKFPLLKSATRTPYKKQIQALESKNLLTGYKPNVNDIIEAQRVLTSPGMQIEHEAVNEAVANALEGNFTPWFRLQSSVKSEGRRLSKKGGVHNELGDKLYNLAEKMHAEQEAAQIARGAPEAAAYQRQGKARTAKYHKISPISKIATGAAASVALPKWVIDMLKAAAK